MGTTLTMAVANNWKLYVVHAGDSRCYLFRDQNLRQLTTDHTLVSELLRHGLIEPAAAAHHQFRHVVTNAIGGGQESVTAEVQDLELQPDDVVLLCTDGLFDMLPDAKIAEILRSEVDPRLVCDRLIDQALEEGGRDNVTVIVSRFELQSAGHVDAT
jgi:protein phosphatase